MTHQLRNHAADPSLLFEFAAPPGRRAHRKVARGEPAAFVKFVIVEQSILHSEWPVVSQFARDPLAAQLDRPQWFADWMSPTARLLPGPMADAVVATIQRDDDISKLVALKNNRGAPSACRNRKCHDRARNPTRDAPDRWRRDHVARAVRAVTTVQIS